MDESKIECINIIFSRAKNDILPEYRKSIFEDGKTLEQCHISTDIGESSKPEEFTKNRIIYKIIDETNAIMKDTEISLPMFEGHRWGDRRVDIDDKKYILEAKKLNENLYDPSPNGAVNQIRRALSVATIKERYDGGIATNGREWVFIDKDGNDKGLIDAIKDTDRLFKILNGEKIIKQELKQEDISKKFYKQYSELLNGGSKISSDDCLINSLCDVVDEDREEIAQRIINRLIFIKMLQSKDLIKFDVINYIANAEPEFRNFKLNQLFFKVMNRPIKERDQSIDGKFTDIPYLNGGLFTKSEAELRNPDYSVRPAILKEIALFLDSFKYTDEWDDTSDSLDPEILGYIFEMAMAETERSETGSFYTPKEITEYMAETSIEKQIVTKVNTLIIPEYRNIPLIEKYEDLFDDKKMGIHRDAILTTVLNNIIIKMKICDNACGSGAFLLASANILFKIAKEIGKVTKLSTPDIGYKKLIMINCIYGVDLNKKAVEIAKLRLWLWLIGSYRVGDLNPLPNIDYNIRCGNSIVGYARIDKFKKNTLRTIDDWAADGSNVSSILKRKDKLVAEYKGLSGDKAKELKTRIVATTNNLKKELDKLYYQEKLAGKVSPESYLSANPFHWGLEFSDVYEAGGFDIIVGNPPYVENKEIDETSKLIYKELFKTAYKLYDLSTLFMERSYTLLKDKGSMSYITTNKFLASDYGLKIRQFLMDNTSLNYLIDVSYVKIFKEASAYPVIIGYDKELRQDNSLITYPHIDTTVEFKKELSKKQQTIKQEDYRLTDTLIFNISDNIGICQKMDSGNVVKIDKLSPIFVYRPFGFTGWDEKVNDFVYEQTATSLRIISTPNISRFHVNNEKMRLAKQPIEKAFIEKDKITEDQWKKLSKPQLLIKEVSKGLTVAITKGSEYAHLTGIYGLYFDKKINLNYILGLLNSDLINFYYGSYYSQIHLAGGYWKINGSYLKTIPIAIVDDEKSREVESIVKKLIEVSSKETFDENDEEYIGLIESLNTLVYEIYNISEEERSVVASYVRTI